MKGKLTFDEALKQIRGTAHPKRASLQGLSDISAVEEERLGPVWPNLPVERRRWLLHTLAELADDNPELDFTYVYRVALDDPDEEVRATAVDALWECKDDAIAEHLLRLLMDDSSAEVRATAASGLGRFTYLMELGELSEELGQRLRAALLATVFGPQPLEVRRQAVEALGFLSGDREVEHILAAAYGDREPSMRISSVFAMGRSADVRWLDTLVGELASEDDEIRFEAARALGEIGDERAVPALLNLLLDADAEVRLATVEALGQIGGEQAIRALRALKQGEDEALAEAAEEALQEAEFLQSPLNLGLEDVGLDVKSLGKRKK